MKRLLTSAMSVVLTLALTLPLQAAGHGQGNGPGKGGHGGHPGSHGPKGPSHPGNVVHKPGPGGHKPGPGVHKSGQPVSYKGGWYHGKYGTKFNHGWYYRGWNHRHWTHVRWWGRWHTRCYWCPSTNAWYYWSRPHGCFYPCSYVNEAPPDDAGPNIEPAPEASETQTSESQG